MRRQVLLLCAVMGVLTAACRGDAQHRQSADSADVVVWNAKVLTVTADFSRAEAVAIRNGVFTAVGANEDAKKLIGTETRVIDAHGHTVVPGLIETHVYATGAARGEVFQPFVQLHSISEIQEWVRARAKETPAGETRGLEGATIQLGPDGEPTGVIENGRALLAKVIPHRAVSDAEYLESLARLMGRYNEVGITSISERSSGPDGYRHFQQLHSEGRLPVRVNVTIRVNPDGTVEDTERVLRELPFEYGDGNDWVRVGPLKIGVDGGTLYGTSYMREPYPKSSFALYRNTDPGYRGSFRPGSQGRAQLGSHAGVRSGFVAQPVPSIPHDVHRYVAEDPERRGNRAPSPSVARGRASHDDD